MARVKANHPALVIKRINEVEHRAARICGPMVRYSKLPFRELVRGFDADIVYSPMILAREFVRSEMARETDFTTNSSDTPLIVQFGSNNALDLARAAKMIQPYCDGIGLNCGCPIKEQVREGIGAALMSSPDLVVSMVKAVKEACGEDFCVEVKIRIHRDLNETISYVKKVENSGADILTIHGRTKNQRSSEAVNLEAIRYVRSQITNPRLVVVANGDAFCLADVAKTADFCDVNGVMAVRGCLQNPAMFSGYDRTPWMAVERFMDLATRYGLQYKLVQHHFSEMLDHVLTKRQKKLMNECSTMVELVDWFDKYFILKRPGEEGFGEGIELPWRGEPL